MCGITGIYAFTEAGEAFLPRLDDAVEALALRGPDHRGKFQYHRTAMGHTRLSIIDTSENAHQPFADPSGRYVIVYNGEIYNYRQIRQELSGAGVRFHTASDTEVLLQVWIRHGKECLDKLNGFFAFALYDKQEETLFLARDRFGIKPLLIYSDPDKLIFASELKGLMACGIPREPDLVSLGLYLHLNYIPAPSTILKNVFKVLPGHYLKISAKSTETGCYYRIPAVAAVHGSPPPSYDEAKSRLFELMDASVRDRLVADVPLGAFLSGGIDSSVVVALASRHTSHLSTFSIGFRDEPVFDETAYARLVAKKYGTDHTEFSVRTPDLYAILNDVLEALDEPFADSSALAVFILSRLTREHVKVALSGDGADEQFGGYIKHTAEYRARRKGAANLLVHMGAPLWSALPKSRNTAFGNKVRQLDKFAGGLPLDEQERYWRWCGFTGAEECGRMLPGIRDTEDYHRRKRELLSHIHHGGGMNEVLLNDMHLVLPNDMLAKVDLMSMSNGLEVRVPFLDHRVVEFGFSLPFEYKTIGKQRKRVVRDAFREILPKEIYNRPKHGFEVPLLKWFRNELRPLIDNDLLHKERITGQGILNPDEVERLKRRLFSNDPGDAVARTWGLVVFQHWWKKYME